MDYQNDLIAEFDREAGKTRKMLEAVPDGVDWSYKPSPKSMSLGQLAGHITDMTGDWTLHTLNQDKLEFGADHKFEPFIPTSKAELLARFDRALPASRAALVQTTGDKWDRNWQFVYNGTPWIDLPKHQVFRDMVMNHMIHHRAQLSVYLRLVGAKLPGMYGPSADEM
jgi:uncharacterized damage-inducible protein DinB